MTSCFDTHPLEPDTLSVAPGRSMARGTLRAGPGAVPPAVDLGCGCGEALSVENIEIITNLRLTFSSGSVHNLLPGESLPGRILRWLSVQFSDYLFSSVGHIPVHFC